MDINIDIDIDIDVDIYIDVDEDIDMDMDIDIDTHIKESFQGLNVPFVDNKHLLLTFWENKLLSTGENKKWH